MYRECGGDGLAGWTIVQLAEVTYDPELTPNALKHAEEAAISAMRARGEPLLNKNRAVDTTNAARREYMAEWRRRNPGYMVLCGHQGEKENVLLTFILTSVFVHLPVFDGASGH